MKIPSSSVALLTLSTFIHCNIAMAWVPVDTASGQPVPSPSAVPLYRDYGNSTEEYYIYFNPDNRELLWKIVSHNGKQDEVYNLLLPEYVKNVSASVFYDSRVYIAGMTMDQRWFISALNQFGEALWSRKGSVEDKEIYPIDIEINKLLVGGDGSELYVHSKYKGVPRIFALETLDGRGIQISSGRLGRKLFQMSETSTPDSSDSDSVFPHPEEQARTVVIDWLLGLIGGIGGAIGFIGAGYGLYQFKKGLNEEQLARNLEKEEILETQKRRYEQDWRDEYRRRRDEHEFVKGLANYKLHKKFHLYKPDVFRNPFIHLVSEASGAGAFDLTAVDQDISRISEEMKQDSAISSDMRLHQIRLNNLLSREHIIQELFLSLKVGNKEIVLKILKSNRHLIDQVDEDGNTPLHYAALGDLGLIRSLIELGATVNVANKHGYTPIMLAATSDDEHSAISFFHILRAQAYIPNHELSVLFHVVVNRSGSQKVKLLVERELHRRLIFHHIPRDEPAKDKEKYNSQSTQGLTIFHETVISGNLQLIEYFFQTGFIDNPDMVDDNGNTLLHYAVSHDITEGFQIITFLLEKGANINSKNNNGDTPLHYAVYRGDNYLVEFLGEQGVELKSIENKQGLTPIDAVFQSEVHCTMLLALLPHLPERLNKKGQTIFHLVAKYRIKGWNEIIEYIVDGDLEDVMVNIDAEDNDGNTAFNIAIIFENIRTMDVLAKKGASIHKAKLKGKTSIDLVEESTNPKVKETMNNIIKNTELGTYKAETSFATP